ncbi:MAG TPA: hypothetical protein VKV96_04120, partial [Roseiarcus sp.]|nr:hypothetical protein [Roseiarcus sp.]
MLLFQLQLSQKLQKLVRNGRVDKVAVMRFQGASDRLLQFGAAAPILDFSRSFGVGAVISSHLTL